jgi:cystathionine beta-lyase/cystathionine gamma-synthase
VVRVHWPGLPSHPDHALAAVQLDGPGAMVAFEMRDGASARRVYDRLRLVRRLASLGDVESTMLHPASSSHRGLSPEERRRAGITDGLLRLSVGIEDPADLIADLDQALGEDRGG